MAPKPKQDRLPFEPKQTKQKAPKKVPASTAVATPATKGRSPKDDASLSVIPDAVSKRMIRRMALFSGVPTALGISTFVVAYYVVSNQLLELPTVAVLLVSLGCFGIGVVGLSYGILSTSWDENRVGSPLGWEEFSLNLGRMVEAWRAGRQESRSKS
ncbi:hypothetical protein NIES970_18060 [[Synechococcus] sp. NIES-970]|uniref:PAM68 family protein n=1 Tax=Picosynechococcus sp. NKBG15041c TaxID=1407650 RepID=UPI00041EBA2F|nr:PAM68 family protein [Picosynechococcus sp. NKBG15041c]BAW96864.1 hypothetical protein NIES970_18060 [[Synechococcus] sp. NIES-970]